MPRRFPPPWSVSGVPGGYRVSDAGGLDVAFVYGDDRPRGANEHRMTKDEARRIALGIARLPELMRADKDQ